MHDVHPIHVFRVCTLVARVTTQERYGSDRCGVKERDRMHSIFIDREEYYTSSLCDQVVERVVMHHE